jgi:hypothetical protein
MFIDYVNVLSSLIIRDVKNMTEKVTLIQIIILVGDNQILERLVKFCNVWSTFLSIGRNSKRILNAGILENLNSRGLK